MSLTYCLTCNEQVTETAGGTCPLGHPVAAHDLGPEPWVGFAGHGADAGIVRPAHRAAPSPQLVTVPPAASSINGATRQPANGKAADDLSAMLADALRAADPAPPLQASSPAPPPAPPVSPVPPAESGPAFAPPPAPVDQHRTGTVSWDDLASLAAELQLDGKVGVNDGPAPRAGAAATDVPTGTQWVDDQLDSMLADLSAAERNDGSSAPPAPGRPAPTFTPPPPPTPAAIPSTLVDLASFEDIPPPPQPLPSAPTAPPMAAPIPIGSVDLSNFTARGARVSGGKAPADGQTKRRRKR